jgi:hypothetical protein
MIIAIISALCLSTTCLTGTASGLGTHLWNLSLLNLPVAVSRITKLLYGCYISYATAITFAKLSICASFLRHFPQIWLRRTVFATAGVTMSLFLTSIFAIVFTCYPVEAAWDSSIEGKCFPIVHFFIASTVVNVVTNFLLCILLLPMLWRLNLPLGQRFVVCGLFSMGTLYVDSDPDTLPRLMKRTWQLTMNTAPV